MAPRDSEAAFFSDAVMEASAMSALVGFMQFHADAITVITLSVVVSSQSSSAVSSAPR
jgi:hypothetical protein